MFGFFAFNGATFNGAVGLADVDVTTSDAWDPPWRAFSRPAQVTDFSRPAQVIEFVRGMDWDRNRRGL